MPNLATLVSSAAGAGRIEALKPILSHTATGEFTITNYDPNLIYNLSSGSRNGNKISLSNVNQSATITARYPKSIANSASATCERKAITSTTSYFVQTGGFYTYNGPCIPGHTCYGTCGPGTNNCGTTPGYTTCCIEDPVPSGYVKQFGEWSKVL